MNPAGNTNVNRSGVGPAALTKSEPLDARLRSLARKGQGDHRADRRRQQQNRSTTTLLIDFRTAAACTNAKAANIKIYTVRVIDGDAKLLATARTRPTCTTT